MLYYSEAIEDGNIDENRFQSLLAHVIAQIENERSVKKVIILPPDFTRFHSRAGDLSQALYAILGDRVKMILPALGTHYGMTEEEKKVMFKGIPLNIIKDHDHQNDVVELGRISSKEVSEISSGAVEYDWPVQVNKVLVEEDWDLIISVGQVVPHEVAGMANYTKNILVGTGGKECIDKSHFVGAACDMEKIMGQIYSPVRDLLNIGSERYLKQLPIIYVQTVVAPNMKGGTLLKGLFIGDDQECYLKAAQLAQKTNIFLLEKEADKIVVYMDGEEYKSTWVGNKAVYRTRLALADGAELVVMAPGIHSFGENPTSDKFIRKYGYCGHATVNTHIKDDQELAENLGSASHLIHGSTEGRFTVTHCPGHLSREEIESVGFNFGDLNEYLKKYNPKTLKDGWNTVDGEEIFFVSNPGLGLWAYKERFSLL